MPCPIEVIETPKPDITNTLLNKKKPEATPAHLKAVKFLSDTSKV